MDCFTILFASLFLIVGIAQGIDWIRKNNLNNRISEALENGKFDEYIRLVNLREKKEITYQNEIGSYPPDTDYIEALFILDAAEHGVFFPHGHEVFERLDNRNFENYEEIDDNYNEYKFYDDYYDEQDDPDLDEHWGLG
jgi:hypothetical protein